MSDWINKDLFDQFREEKQQEKDVEPTGLRRSDISWPTPEKGTSERPKTYEGRLLPDPNGVFYKKYFYHMFSDGERWQFILCPKTFDFEHFCSLCQVTSRLYQMTAADKKKAGDYKRKEKFVANWFIVDDPRDSDREEGEKMSGTVKAYEFPGKVERKVREEITDTKNGLGHSIFDPGEGGYNFILKVLSTKPDKQKKVWPDYSNSVFARKPSAIGDESEIKDIMTQRIDIMEYIKALGRTEEDIINVLKAEMVYDLIEEDWNKAKRLAGELIESDKEESSKTDDEDVRIEETSDDERKGSDANISDEELLAELANL